MKLGEFDKSGRRKPEQKTGHDFVVEADQIITAIGQTIDPKEVFDGVAPELSRGNWVKINPVNGQTNVDWVFAAGDVVTGPASVVDAIAAGERAAVGMDEFLTGAKHAFWREWKMVQTKFDPDADPVRYGESRHTGTSGGKTQG